MQWFYAEGGVQKGPVSGEAFADLVRSGAVRDDTLVWREDLPDWAPYSAVKPRTAPAPPAPPSFAPAAAAMAASAPVAAPASFCTNCGRQFLAHELVNIYGRPVCAQCKPQVLQQVREGAPAATARVYGGFWIRFVALLIDGILLSIVGGILSVPFFMLMFSGIEAGGEPNPAAALGSLALIQLIHIGLTAGYQAWFLVNKGATLGKMALGLKVIRANGGPITYGLAIGRYFATIVSGMILGIGYIIAAFDVEKRALHDRICDTRVIKG